MSDVGATSEPVSSSLPSQPEVKLSATTTPEISHEDDFSECDKGKHTPALMEDELTYVTPPYCSVCGEEGDDILHKYHALRLSGGTFCDTCNSPYCDLL